MNSAGRNLLGQAILGIPGHITKAYDSYKEGQNTRYAQGLQMAENARQEQQLRMQMAQAQVAAEKARQEMQYLPEEMKNKAEEIRLRGKEVDIRGKEVEHRMGEQGRQDIAYKRTKANKVVDKFQTAEGRQAFLSKPEGYWDDPANAAEFKKLETDDANLYRDRQVRVAGGRATASANALTKAIGEREQVKPEAYSRDTTDLIKSFREQLVNTTDSSKMNAPEAAAIIATQLRSRQRDLLQKAEAYKAKGDTISQMAGSRMEAEAAAIDRTLSVGEQTLQQSLAPTSDPEAPPPARIAQPLSPQQLQLLQGNPDEELDPAQFGL